MPLRAGKLPRQAKFPDNTQAPPIVSIIDADDADKENAIPSKISSLPTPETDGDNQGAVQSLLLGATAMDNAYEVTLSRGCRDPAEETPPPSERCRIRDAERQPPISPKSTGRSRAISLTSYAGGRPELRRNEVALTGLWNEGSMSKRNARRRRSDVSSGVVGTLPIVVSASVLHALQ